MNTSPLNKTLIAIAALTAASPFAHAADAATTSLEPVFVTATRTPVPADDVLAATITITRADIERTQANDIADLLRLHAGLDIGRSGGPGQLTSVFIRGGESDHTLVLIDGVRINPSTIGGAALANLTPEVIERIEIVKGPRSTLYGSDAIAGVINIITRAPEGKSGQLMIRQGSYDTREIGGGVRYGNASSGVSLDVQKTKSDGFPTFEASEGDRGYDMRTVALRARTQLGPVKLGLQGYDADGMNEYYNPVFTFDPVTFESTRTGFDPVSHDTLNRAYAATAEAELLKNWTSTLTASYAQDSIEENQSDNIIRTIRPEYRWDNSVLFAGQRLGFGGFTAEDRSDVEDGFNSIHDKRDHEGGYVQAELARDRHHGLLGLATTHYTGFKSEVTYNAEYGFDVTPKARVLGSIGTGFHAPSAYDRFGFGGSPNLKPERSRSIELGARYLISAGQSVDVRVFRNVIRDLITVAVDPSVNPATDPDFGFRAQNINRAENEGVEVAYSLVQGPWTARLEGIIQDPVDCSTDDQGNTLTPSNCDEGGSLLRRAKQSVTASLTRQIGRVNLGADVLGTSKRADVDADTFARTKDAGYALLNLSAKVDIHRGLSLALRADNVLDQQYQTANGYRQPGASGYATLRYQFNY
ncbi:MAG: TonB-dependent receptor [Stagnimonas sp.]|nr:TonB-dependent receptor [Stagnimonas sp.]